MASVKVVAAKDGSKRYRARVRMQGTYRSGTFRTRYELNQFIAEHERAALVNLMVPERQAGHRLFGDLLAKYVREVLETKARTTYRQQFAQLDWWMGFVGPEVPLAKVTAAVVSEAKAALQPRSNDTINCYLAALSRVYTYAVKEWGWTAVNPVQNVFRLPAGAARCRFLSDPERARLLFWCKASPNRMLYAIAVLALSTGARKEEIMRTRWLDVDLKRNRIWLEKTKNRDRRGLKLYGTAMEELRRLHGLRSSDDDFIFPAPLEDGQPVDFRTAWKTARRRAGLTDFHFHDLRHCTASYLAMEGASLKEIQEILGHRTIKTTSKYTHVTDLHAGRLVERMNKAFV